MTEYNVSLDILGDYATIFIQYGYVTLFVAACPIAPFMAYLSNLIEIRSDGHKLLHIHRRVLPVGAQDVGTWMVILQMTSVIAVITNAGILCFTMKLIHFHEIGTIWLFIGFQYSIFLAMAIFAAVVDDVPEYVSIQLGRQEYLNERLSMTDEEIAHEKMKNEKKKMKYQKQHSNSSQNLHNLDTIAGSSVSPLKLGNQRYDTQLFEV
jgi:hypothetical protein